MTQSFRQAEILALARREGKVTVEGLAAHFDVTLQTIRRDLTELDLSGHLTRVHGGAIIPSGTSNVGYEERRTLNANAKEAIASACAADIPDDCTVFLGIGTSTEAVARALTQHKRLMVVTNNMNVANILQTNIEAEVILTGGQLRRSDGGLTGALTMDTINRFKFDVAVMGCSALDDTGDLMDFDIEEVGISKGLIERARKSVLVADHSKFHRTAPARICAIGDLDRFYTDLPLPDPLQKAVIDWPVSVQIARPQAVD